MYVILYYIINNVFYFIYLVLLDYLFLWLSEQDNYNNTSDISSLKHYLTNNEFDSDAVLYDINNNNNNDDNYSNLYYYYYDWFKQIKIFINKYNNIISTTTTTSTTPSTPSTSSTIQQTQQNEGINILRKFA